MQHVDFLLLMGAMPPHKQARMFDVYLAAISGICANPNFFGPTMQQSPKAAHEFALQVCIETYSAEPGQ